MKKINKKTIRFVKREEKLIISEWNHYKLALTIIVILITLESYLTGSLERFLLNLGNYEYLGALFAGFFYTYGATTAFSIATFFILAEALNPWILAFLGALSSIVSEYIIYDFVSRKSGKIIKIGNKKYNIPEIKSNFVKKISPLIAGFIIASPLPDEFAAILLGAEKYDRKKFILLAFIFNFIGILFIVTLGRIL